MKSIELGQTAKDIITGFKGVVVGTVFYMSGCNQAFLVPPVSTDGKRLEGEWFDVQRLERVGKTWIKLENAKAPGADSLPPRR